MLDYQDDDQGTPRIPTIDKPTDNTELLVHCMQFSRFGALAQMFIIDAITKATNAVAAADLQALENPMVNPVAWQGVAREIKGKLDAFYQR